MRRTLTLILLLSLLAAPASQAVELLRWDHLPLAVQLVIGEERIVIVGAPVRIGVPAALDGRLRVQSADGAVYLRANAPIKSTRIELQELGSGELILIDITARPGVPGVPPLEPIRIVDEVTASSEGHAVAEDAGEANVPSPQSPGAGPPMPSTPLAVALTRYAAQSLYAPLRTVEPLPGITPVSVPRHLALDTLLPMLPVRATALAAWRLDGTWVTAVRLTNTSNHTIDLDPRLLQGDFIAATFQHPNLGPAGHSTDTTVVYLVTRGTGIARALLPHASRFDAALELGKARIAPLTNRSGRHAP